MHHVIIVCLVTYTFHNCMYILEIMSVACIITHVCIFPVHEYSGTKVCAYVYAYICCTHMCTYVYTMYQGSNVRDVPGSLFCHSY